MVAASGSFEAAAAVCPVAPLAPRLLLWVTPLPCVTETSRSPLRGLLLLLLLPLLLEAARASDERDADFLEEFPALASARGRSGRGGGAPRRLAAIVASRLLRGGASRAVSVPPVSTSRGTLLVLFPAASPALLECCRLSTLLSRPLPEEECAPPSGADPLDSVVDSQVGFSHALVLSISLW